MNGSNVQGNGKTFKNTLKEDPAVASIPYKKLLEMISVFEKKATEVIQLLNGMLADRQNVQGEYL